MGKSKKMRSRPNPLGIPRTLEKLQAEKLVTTTDPSGSTFIQTIMHQLTSHVELERDSGLNSLSIATQQQRYVPEVKQSDVVKTVAPLLLDPSPSVRNSAAGALRNMSCVGGDMCQFMVKQGVMVPLVLLVREYATPLTDMDMDTVNKQQQLKMDTLFQCVALLWNLCSTQSTALKIFNKEQLHLPLVPYLSTTTTDNKLATEVAHLLCTVTEDNPDLPPCPALTQTLTSLLTTHTTTTHSNQHHLQTLSLSILLNLHDYTKLPQSIRQSLVPILMEALTPNHIDLCNRLSTELTNTNENDDDESLKLLLNLEEHVTQVGAVINCQQNAIELLSNVLCFDDDDDDDDELMDCDDVEQFSGGVPMELFTNLTLHIQTLLPLLLSKIGSLPVQVESLLKQKSSVKLLSIHKNLRTTALICLQNLYETLPLQVTEQSTPTIQIITGLVQLLLTDDPSDFDLIEAITSSLRSILTCCLNEKLTLDLSTHLPLFQQLYTKINEDKIRVNILKSIGSVAILSKDQLVLKAVGTFLMASIPKIDKANIWLTAELLDTIMDVFCEDDSDVVVGEIGLVSKLKAINGQFKKVAKSERRGLKEHRAVVDTVLENLMPFLEYKIKRQQ